MSDPKSKLPDLKEITSIANKLFKDIKQSVTEVIDEYKKKRLAEKTEVVSSSKGTTKKEEGTVKNTKSGEEEVAKVATAQKNKTGEKKPDSE